MRTIKSYLCITVLLASFGVQFAKAQLTNNGEYETAMKNIVAKIDTASSISDFQQCRNTFERIALKHPNEWLATYYVAYTDIEMTYIETGNSKNLSRLQDAKNWLEKLNKLEGADKSETATLWGYYYMALVVSDPQINGKKYSGDVTGFFEKAKALNTANPRATFWSAFYNEKLPSFMRSKIDYCKELQKARKLFNAEEKSWERPHWGNQICEKEHLKCNK